MHYFKKSISRNGIAIFVLFLVSILFYSCSSNNEPGSQSGTISASTVATDGAEGISIAQKPQSVSSSQIYAALQKLNTLGSVLYVGAHPDDENTSFITYLANQKNLDVTYLAMTRGDGGQNLLGSQLRELLGVIRTQELLMARRVDGGHQYFTRANDFGFSKSASEALELWGKNKILSDVVWAIRKLHPDIIINRFSTDTTIDTHGHHTASAILSSLAFDMAGDTAAFPEQLQYVEPWQPTRLFYNTSWWRYESREAFNKEVQQNPNFFSIDIGAYYPLKGQSNDEIAAISRSMHRSQGFGQAGERGKDVTYLKLLKGSPAEGSIFDGIDLSWSRIEGGQEIGVMVAGVLDNYKLGNPAASIPALLEVYTKIKALPPGFWKSKKLTEVKNIIQWCAGLYLQADAAARLANPGDEVTVNIEAVNRSNADIQLQSVQFTVNGSINLGIELKNNIPFIDEASITLPDDIVYSSPYWLRNSWTYNRYTVKKQTLRGLPETPQKVQAIFQLTVNGVPLNITQPVVYSTVKDAGGEVIDDFVVVPTVTLHISGEVYVYSDDKPKSVEVTVTSHSSGIDGELKIETGSGWEISPASYNFNFSTPGQQKTYAFKVTPPQEPAQDTLRAVASVNGKSFDQEMIIIDYDHIPTQIILEDATAKVLKMNLVTKGHQIAYIMGAGDVVPTSLEQIGYEVDLLDPSSITLQKLEKYDALITGVRAYNTVEALKFVQPTLFEYVKNGGTMIMQYNKSFGLVTDKLAPFPLELSRLRVTEENNAVTFLAPDHPLLNFPNEITKEDFEGWVQERGLYYASSWDDAFTPIFAANDRGEPLRKGGMLVAQYGKGYFIYTGQSWFRELPAGVPGAFKLFTNMISIGQYPGNGSE